MEPTINNHHIQRYLSRDKISFEDFGDHYRQPRWDFNWYIGDEKIGVAGNPSTEAECFLRRILVDEDKLIITPNQIAPEYKEQVQIMP